MDHGHDHHGHDHHGHDHAHTHDRTHGHDQSHAHDHGAADYYLEQLLTIFVCGAFGVVAILMYLQGMLDGLLAGAFHPWVLAGGIALLFFVLIRGVALWSATSAPAHNHDHDHEHDSECDHAHDSPGVHNHVHAPGDDHSHGNIFWRVVVLAFPLLLFCLGLPNKGFSNDWMARRLGTDVALNLDGPGVAAKGGATIVFNFDELNASASDPAKRAQYEGNTVRVKGQLRKIGSGREYTLFRMKMTCCAADTIPLKARIKLPFVSTLDDFQWVNAEGVLQYVEVPGQNQFIPVIRVKDGAGLEKANPE